MPALVASLHEQDALALDSTRPLDDAVLEKAVSFAISVAALTSRRTGAAPPSRGEVDAYLSERVQSLYGAMISRVMCCPAMVKSHFRSAVPPGKLPVRRPVTR